MLQLKFHLGLRIVRGVPRNFRVLVVSVFISYLASVGDKE